MPLSDCRRLMQPPPACVCACVRALWQQILIRVDTGRLIYEILPWQASLGGLLAPTTRNEEGHSTVPSFALPRLNEHKPGKWYMARLWGRLRTTSADSRVSDRWYCTSYLYTDMLVNDGCPASPILQGLGIWLLIFISERKTQGWMDYFKVTMDMEWHRHGELFILYEG